MRQGSHLSKQAGSSHQISASCQWAPPVSRWRSRPSDPRRRGWSVVALDVDVDTTTPTGELVANITSSVAQWERRIIGQRTSEAMQAMKRRGVRLGRPVELGDDVRRRIAVDHDAGISLRAIAQALNTESVPTARGGRWHASTIRRVLDSLDLDAETTAALNA